jgi:hypothetical protein
MVSLRYRACLCIGLMGRDEDVALLDHLFFETIGKKLTSSLRSSCSYRVAYPTPERRGELEKSVVYELLRGLGDHIVAMFQK